MLSSMRKKLRQIILSLNNQFALIYPNEVEMSRRYQVRDVVLDIQHGSRQSVWRWESMAAGTKEPETLDWIDQYIEPEDVFFDIGACVGNYSLYAAACHPGLRVFAFEPEPNSLVNLVQNASRNKLSVICMQIPLSSGKERVDFFNCNPLYCRDLHERVLGASCFIAGESNHQFGRLLKSHGVDLVPSVSIGMCSCSVDEIVASGLAPAPNHIKIDVDGIESRIIEGMQKTLCNSSLRSLLCEVSTEEEEEAVNGVMQKYNFSCIVKADGRRFGNRIYRRE